MKRILSIIITALLIASLAACGSNSQTEPKETQTITDGQKEFDESTNAAEPESEASAPAAHSRSRGSSGARMSGRRGKSKPQKLWKKPIMPDSIYKPRKLGLIIRLRVVSFSCGTNFDMDFCRWLNSIFTFFEDLSRSLYFLC